MKIIIALFLSLLSIPSFAFRRTEVVEPTAGQLYYSVIKKNDVARLGLKGPVKSCKKINQSDSVLPYYLFDEKGYLKHEEFGYFVRTYQSEYDGQGNQIEVRKMELQPQIRTWIEQYVYDKNNRVLEEIHFSPFDGSVIEYYHYFYNKNGHLVKMEQLRDGKPVPEKVKLCPGCTLTSGPLVMQYDSIGALKCKRMEYPDNSYEFVCADSSVYVRPGFKGVTFYKDGKKRTSLEYEYKQGAYKLTDKQEFVYNAGGQLTSVEGQHFIITYEYDAFGNVVREQKSFFESKKEETVSYIIEYY
ncbi:MAG: RHS repeat protein [Paludibacteraceae bacterium]|nr:RHS repeat protein [Paludibacteraceae bacterium]